MPTLDDPFTGGTVAIDAGDPTKLVFSGVVINSALGLLAGDIFSASGKDVPIKSVDSATGATLQYGWPDSSLASTADYCVLRLSKDRYDPSITQATLRQYLASVQSGGGGRELLTADRTYYVRTDGSDSNNGLANSSSGAFLTLQKAWNTILTIDLSGFAVTVEVGAGTYTQGVDMNTAPLGGLVSWIGDVTTPSNVLISTTGDDCFAMLAATTVSIKGFKLQTTTSGWGIINNGGGGQINYGNIDFGACATGHMRSSAYGALWNINNGNCTISGGAPNHFWAGPLGNIVASAYTTTLVGTPNFSDSFAHARDGALIAPGLTFSGSATGVRYIVDQLGNMSIAGGGASYFPGSVAGSGGSTSGGGSYA